MSWVVPQKCLPEFISKSSTGKTKEVASVLLDSDLREFSPGWFSDQKNQDQLEGQGRIAQVVRVRNIAIPQAEEDQLVDGHGKDGPRLLRLLITDGRTSLSALDVDNCERLSMDTAPGTKLRLLGTIPYIMGFLVLRKCHIQVIGGQVPNLMKEWTMNKRVKGLEGRFQSGENGPPPFVPLGSKEAISLIQSEGRHLGNLRSGRSRDAPFDSFKLASNSMTAEKDNEFDADFLERRKDGVKEAKMSNVPNGNHAVTNGFKQAPAYARFQAGGSKFSQIQAEKTQAYDGALAQLVSLGYPTPLASSAVRIHRGDYSAALDYLLAKQTSEASLAAAGGTSQDSAGRSARGGRRGGRGRGGRGGRGRFDPNEEDDPYFDPAAAAAAAGLPSRPSTGLTRLDDFLPTQRNRPSIQRPGTASASGTRGMGPQQPSASSSSAPFTPRRTPLLPVGCPILAQNMSGEYEEAQLFGHLIPPGGGGGDKVMLVVYSRESDLPGRMVEEEELVPLSLIRTLNKERISIEMVPPAPPHRARAYQTNSQQNSSPMEHGNFQRGGYGAPSMGRFSRGDSGGRGRFSRGGRPSRGRGRSAGRRM